MFFIRRNVLYLPTFFVSNAGDFLPCHEWDFQKTSQQLPKILNDFPKTSQLPKMSRDVPTMFVHLQSYLKDDNFSVF